MLASVALEVNQRNHILDLCTPALPTLVLISTGDVKGLRLVNRVNIFLFPLPEVLCYYVGEIIPTIGDLNVFVNGLKCLGRLGSLDLIQNKF